MQSHLISTVLVECYLHACANAIKAALDSCRFPDPSVWELLSDGPVGVGGSEPIQHYEWNATETNRQRGECCPAVADPHRRYGYPRLEPLQRIPAKGNST